MWHPTIFFSMHINDNFFWVLNMSISHMIYSFSSKIQCKKKNLQAFKIDFFKVSKVGTVFMAYFNTISHNNIHKNIHKWYMNQVMKL
jgi:hypothetical protein